MFYNNIDDFSYQNALKKYRNNLTEYRPDAEQIRDVASQILPMPYYNDTSGFDQLRKNQIATNAQIAKDNYIREKYQWMPYTGKIAGGSLHNAVYPLHRFKVGGGDPQIQNFDLLSYYETPEGKAFKQKQLKKADMEADEVMTLDNVVIF
jgi:hypothetical protein